METAKKAFAAILIGLSSVLLGIVVVIDYAAYYARCALVWCAKQLRTAAEKLP